MEMNNLEDFEKISTALSNGSIVLDDIQLQNFYLGCMTRYLAQIADALNEIKEQTDENDD